jgi:hypothetical protein
LQRTFITELGRKSTVDEGLTSTAGMPNEVVRALENRHVIKAEHRAGSRWYELQHDRLIELIRRLDDTALGPMPQAEPADHLRTAARRARASAAAGGAGATRQRGH